jgi:hypothetical protein
MSEFDFMAFLIIHVIYSIDFMRPDLRHHVFNFDIHCGKQWMIAASANMGGD